MQLNGYVFLLEQTPEKTPSISKVHSVSLAYHHNISRNTKYSVVQHSSDYHIQYLDM